MKKVGIVSCYFKNNYGSMLQAYATQKFLDINGIPNETIDISDLKEFSSKKKKYYLSQITNFSFIKTKFGMLKLKLYKKFNKKLNKKIQIRNKKFAEFKYYFNLSRTFSNYEELIKYSKKNYSDIIVGSDQLWLPVNVVSDYYTLNWVPKEINKISYATSFGISTIPPKYFKLYKIFLSKINYISVRENNAIEIVNKFTNKNAKLVCDPTLLLTKKEWNESIKDKLPFKEKYIFCYFLGKNIEHRKFVEKLRKKTGYKIISLNHCDEFVKYSDTFADEIPYNVGPLDFVNYIKHAEYVCTDSFHGTVFSIINNVNFFSFERFTKNEKMSTNSRIYSLLELLNLENRLLTGREDIEKALNFKIDFHEVNKKIAKFRTDSKKWLLSKITLPYEDENYITISQKQDCSGCTACMSICPTSAITMVVDKEGFLYPKVNKNKCINCGLCKKTCPLKNLNRTYPFKQRAYIFQHRDIDVRHESTSGGAFSAIAEEILNAGGVVFGVAFDSHYKVKHTYITDKKDLYKFRNSKYVQSNLGDTFKKVKEFLLNNRLVLFSGTSCQIAGLKAFLNVEYENLILLDVVCRAVPSPLLWDKYLNMQLQKYQNPKKIYFREKYYGYKYSNLSIYGENHNYHSGVESDPYLRSFFSNICDRPSCYSCKFKTKYRQSDITIWDCFEVEKFNKTLDDDKGTTRILVHTKKGYKIIKQIKQNNICEEISVLKATEDFNGIFSKVKYNDKREMFMKDMNELDSNDLFKKYFPDTFKIKTERVFRKIFLKTGIYKKVITLGKKIRKRV